tara:strand:+ start:5643 stop:6875 length:1233 start_codon:yes stop_codon:yes gene_type:complete
MAQLGFGLNVDNTAQTGGYDQYQTSFFDTLGAVAKETWNFNPLKSTQTLSQLATERSDAAMEQQIPISRDILNKQHSDKGLFFEEDEYQSVVDIMLRAKEEERARQDIIARGPTGVGVGIAKFGVGLGVSLLDPINLASAFIPVVNQARMAKLVASQGFTKARLIRGAAEGAVGAAIVEPLVYLAATDIQADYGLTDSFLNITFGTILGGGLHTAVGKFQDVRAEKKFRREVLAAREKFGVESDVTPELNLYKKYYPENSEFMMALEKSDPRTHRALLEKSVNDLLLEKPVDVVPIAKADPELNKAVETKGVDIIDTVKAVDNSPLTTSGERALDNIEKNTVNKGEPEIDTDILSLKTRLDAKRAEGPELKFDQDQAEIDLATKELDEIEAKPDEIDFAVKDAINCMNGR